MQARPVYVETTGVKTSACPVCLELHEAVTSVKLDWNLPRRPAPGDYTLCDSCGAVLKFDQQMNECAVPAAEETAYMATLDRGLRNLLLRRREAIVRRNENQTSDEIVGTTSSLGYENQSTRETKIGVVVELIRP